MSDPLEIPKENDMEKITEHGSLVLKKKEDTGELIVSFADWSSHKGSITLLEASQNYVIFSKTLGHKVMLNGSQAVTVKGWAEKYL